jgi:glycosyltransferase involved in cell wall biosynthesis
VREVPPVVDEVIVVDNGSRDRTVMEAWEVGVTVVSEPRRGYGYACFIGIAAAAGVDVIVFLDGDRSDYPTQLVNVVRRFRRAGGPRDRLAGRGRREAGAHPWYAVAGTRACVALINRLTGSRATDLKPFRAITADALLHLDMRDRTYK